MRTRSLIRPGGYVVAALLTAAVMGLELAHALEWGPKEGYPPALYVRLQESLYVWFGNVGSVLYVLAILTTVAQAVLVSRDPRVRWLVGAAAAAEVAALIVFFTVVYPVNLRFPVHGNGTVPADWAALRDRWEAGHVVGFVLFLAAFVLVLIAALRNCETVPVPREPVADNRARGVFRAIR